MPIAIATDHNPGSSPTLSPLLMLSMACTLFRLTPEEALRGMTVNAARALGLRDRGTLAAGRRADFVAWDVEHPNELAYWFGRNPCAASSRGGKERATSRERAGLHLHRGTHAAAGEPAARRHRACPTELQRRYWSSARSAFEDTDWHLEPLYAFARELGASVLVPRYSRYLIDLNRPPENTPMYPGANNTELCPTRFFTGDPLYRDGRAPDAGRDRAPARRLLAALPRRARGELARLQRRSTATRCCGTGTASRRELPWLFEGRLPDLNLGTARRRELRAGAARCADGVLAAQRASPTSPTAASRAATSRATTAGRRQGVHAVQLEMCWSLLHGRSAART